MMTSEDYMAIAAEFYRIRHRQYAEYDPYTWRLVRSALADCFEADNLNFDRELFYDACGEFHLQEES